MIIMLSSSIEYLEAFRQDNYLLFLEWPRFIVAYYGSVDADQILNALIFEWLNNGFCEEDVKKLVVLMAVYSQETRPIRGALDWALTNIAGAAAPCMVYQNNQLQAHYLAQNKMKLSEINELMECNKVYFSQENFAKKCEQELVKLYNWSNECADKERMIKAYDRIYSVTRLRYFVEDYLNVVKANQNAHIDQEDQLWSTRTSRIKLIQRLLQYLNEQMEYTTDVMHEITCYTDAIRKQGPELIEEEYLEILSPPSPSFSFVDIGRKVLIVANLGIFSLLQLPSDVTRAASSSSKESSP